MVGFATMCLVLLNYILEQWKEDSLDLLKTNSQNSSFKDSQNSTYPQKPSPDNLKDTKIQGAEVSKVFFNKNIKDQLQKNQTTALTLVNNKLYPDWVYTLTGYFKDLQGNFWHNLRNCLGYMINLFEFDEDEDGQDSNQGVRRNSNQGSNQGSNQLTTKLTKQKISEISETVEKIKSKQNGQQSEKPSLKNSLKTPAITSSSTSSKPKIETLDTATSKDSIDKKTTSSKGVNTKQQQNFKRLEAKILAKLKEMGMNRYDIWLELGNLYLKFEENEKAKEIFALVLRHSKEDPEIRETARNNLIGLGV